MRTVWLAIVIAGCSEPTPVTQRPTKVRPAPACEPAWLDRTWGHRTNLLLDAHRLIAYDDQTIVVRPVPDGPTTAILSGYISEMNPVIGGGYIYWHGKIAAKRNYKLMVSPIRGGAPVEIPGDVEGELCGAPDGVIVRQRDRALHVARDGKQTVLVEGNVNAVAVAGTTLYAAFGTVIARRPLDGGDFEVVAQVQRRVQAMVVTRDRIVWLDDHGGVYTTQPDSMDPRSLGRARDGWESGLHLVASPSGRVYVGVDNMVLLVGQDELSPFVKTRAGMLALVADDDALYAIVEESGLARLCHEPFTIRKPSPDAFCPPDQTDEQRPNGYRRCIDAKGQATFFHRAWYASGDLQSEHLPDGTIRQLWADGTPR